MRVNKGVSPVLLLWELPQTLLGLLCLAALALGGHRPRARLSAGRFLVQTRALGVSLGLFVFWSGGERIRRHELGHAVQSRLLGPLYLPLVGLPSLGRVAYALLHDRWTGRRWTGYYQGYPENWADRLGRALPGRDGPEGKNA